MSRATVGTLLAGRYRLVEHLATGGMGTVWEAHDDTLDRPVAVKEVLLPPGLDDEAMDTLRRRTMREARSAARLRHPAIVTIYDVVEHDGQPWIVMELVESQSLAAAIRTRGSLPPAEVAAIGLRILDALVTAYAAGVQHRDVKPANVLLAAAGRVVLTDFGIARQVGDETLTSAGLLIGSPDFLSPERARGQDAPGLQSDLWSLGATLYAAVEGRTPFHRNGPLPTLAAVVMDEPAPPQRAGPLWPVIDGLLVKDPAYRLDADRTRTLLQRALRGRPEGWRPRQLGPRPPRPAATAELPVVRPAEHPAGAGTAGRSGGAPAVRRDGAAAPAAAGAAAAAAAAGAAAGLAGSAAPAERSVGIGAPGAAAGAARPTAPDAPATAGAPRGAAATTPVRPDGAVTQAGTASGAGTASAAAAAATARAGTATTPDATSAPGKTTTPGATREPGTATPAGATGAPGTRAPGTTTTPGATTPPGSAARADTATGAGMATAAGDTVQAGKPADTRKTGPAGPGVPDRRSGTTGATAPPAGTGTGTTGPGRPRRRRGVLVAAAALAAAAVAAVAIPLALDDDPSGDRAGPARTTAPAGTGAPGAPGAQGAPGGTTPDAAATGAGAAPTATGTATGPSGPSGPGQSSPPGTAATTGTATNANAIPAGFVRYTDPTDGFSVAIPRGWSATRNGPQVRFREPSSGRFLMIETSDTPQADPLVNWINYERTFSRGKTGYQNLGIRRVSYRGWQTADWEFIYGNHVLDRNILVNSKRAHALYWSTPPAQWSSASSRQIFDVAQRTFQPAPTS